MNFDIHSMKQRAKMLLQTTKPNPQILGLLFTSLIVLYIIGFFFVMETEKYIFLLVFELVYMNFRNCSKWYALKVSREEDTHISDIFCAFKEKPVQNILMSLIKDIVYIIAACTLFFIFGLGMLIPFYWFRFSAYVIKDENINAFKSLGRSMKLLKGHYMELIKLDISNIGWCILMIFTFGIAGIYVKPYLSIVYAEFYDYLKAQQELIG